MLKPLRALLRFVARLLTASLCGIVVALLASTILHATGLCPAERSQSLFVWLLPVCGALCARFEFAD